MPKVNGVRKSIVGSDRVRTPTAQQLKREFDAAHDAWLRKRGQLPETRAQVRARFMGRVAA